MVVIATGRDEGRLIAEAAGELEAEDVAVEGKGSVEIGDFEVHVADVGAGVELRWVELR